MLSISFNEATFHAVPYGKGIAFVCHVLMNSVILKLYDIFPPFNILMFCLGSFAFFLVEKVWLTNAGSLYQESKLLVKELSTTGNKELQVVSKSARPISADVGYFYHMHVTTLLTYLINLANYTITLALLS